MENLNNRAIICYVPAIHVGYINFFKKQKADTLYMLGSDFLKEFEKLERDVRRTDPKVIRQLVESLKIFKKVEIIDRKSILNIPGQIQLIMPDDEISNTLAEKYLKGNKIKFVNIFLRWGWKSSTVTKSKISNLGTISKSEFAKKVLKDLYKEAQKSSDWWRQIGSAIFKDGKILKISHNHPLPTDYSFDLYGDPRSNFNPGEHIDKSLVIHSEANIVAWAAREGVSLVGTDLYVTTFPCPNCAKLIALSGIKKIYYAEGYSILDAEEVLKAFKVKLYKVLLD